jgi:hypothetical protein
MTGDRQSMSPPADDETIDALLIRAGLTVPEDLREGLRNGVRELAAMAARMRTPRNAEDEPAIVFEINEVLRDV